MPRCKHTIAVIQHEGSFGTPELGELCDSNSAPFLTQTLTDNRNGQWCAFNNRLPAGGTWAYGGVSARVSNHYSEGITSTTVTSVSGSGGVAAGGTNVGNTNNPCSGFCWRIA